MAVNSFCSIIWALGLSIWASACTPLHTQSVWLSQLRGSVTPEQLKIQEAELWVKNHVSFIVQFIEGRDTTSYPVWQHVMCSEKAVIQDERNSILCHAWVYLKQDIVSDSPEMRKKIDTIRDISQEFITPTLDRDMYEGIKEVWTHPQRDSYGELRGDCEDYVIYHMNLLKELWISEFAMRPIILRQENGEWHLVLAVIMDTGLYILDNLNPENIFVKDFGELEKKSWYTVLKIVGNYGSFLWKDIKTDNKRAS